MSRVTPTQLRLYLVTDRGTRSAPEFLDVIDQAVNGGVTIVQLREKNMLTGEFIKLALAVKQRLASRVPLIINDRVDIALAIEADGVHLGQEDMPPDVARRLLGPDKIIGITIHNDAEAAALHVALTNGTADYAGIGCVFPSATKDVALIGLDGLKNLATLVPAPKVAIGGITADNAAAVMQFGVDGVAVSNAIMGAADVFMAAKNLIYY